MKQRISVRDLVTFLYSAGDLSSEKKSSKALGTQIHQMWQGKYKEDDQKEVFVETFFQHGDYDLHITGRIDGVLRRDGDLVIEEIKSTRTDLDLLKEDTYPAHMMQANMYAYMYMLEQDIETIGVWLTYIDVDTYQEKIIKKRMHIKALERLFKDAVAKYVEWLVILQKHQIEKMVSLEGLTFPFSDHREGQYPFMGAVYQTLVKEDILYALAPTGIGKTVGALFSGIKTIKDPKEKLFYLTAKNAGKGIVVDTVNLLKEKGLKAKAITLHSKEHMCLMEEVDCDPDICPYAKGFYDRLKEALEDIFVHDDVYTAKLIKDYGQMHTVCPHEFALEISNYADIVICDYNYVFDPRVRLIRYFEEDYYSVKLLIDEAHNLVDRSKAMYSAMFSKKDIEDLLEECKTIKPSITRPITMLLNYMNKVIKEEDVLKAKMVFYEDLDLTMLEHVNKVINKLDQFLTEQKKHAKRKIVRNAYFLLMQFVRISEYFGHAFRYKLEATYDDDVEVQILCFDASKHLYELIEERVNGAVFFSATLKPVDYFARLLTKGHGKYFEVPSPFSTKHLGLYMDVSTSTRYKDRANSVTRIVDTLYAMLESKVGNYIAFFPSYRYMQMVLEVFDQESYDVTVQTRDMSIEDKDQVLVDMKKKKDQSSILFSVLGGSFSEGVDYVSDMLVGVLVVGVALPAYNANNELLRSYFDEEGLDGFAYAYTYPGMNKVIQAVGRVIRTKEDKGVAVLLDDRYQMQVYKNLFPAHWINHHVLEEEDYVQGFITQFWSQFEEEEK